MGLDEAYSVTLGVAWAVLVIVCLGVAWAVSLPGGSLLWAVLGVHSVVWAVLGVHSVIWAGVAVAVG